MTHPRTLLLLLLPLCFAGHAFADPSDAEMKQADGRAQYELASHGPHAHMVCARCGSLTDLDLDLAALLRGASLARHGFAVDLASYPISGTCAACRA